MDPASVAIVLVAAVVHAAWNLASKYKRGDTVLFVAGYTTVAAAVFLPLAVAAAVSGAQPVTWPLVAAAIVSALLHVAYSLTLQAGYDRADLGVVYPIARGSGPIVTMLVAIPLLGERPSALGIVGAVTVLAGILVVMGNPFRAGASHPLRGVAWGAATGVTIAAYTLWDAFAVGSLGLAPVSYYAGTLLAQVVLLAPSVLRRRAGIARSARLDGIPILAVAVLSPLAYVLVLTVMQTAPVALVAPLREASIVVGSLLAWRLFRETGIARRLAGAAIVLVGIAVVGL
ncbi:DMT family transporter [Microbacterium indicum]|uniref:DMT family transporter n=1 Tax=Microbacterium indicum TaxID=358100 RepID=UPI0003F70E78|nr:DMT family transporter [Microbacterium indicum]